MKDIEEIARYRIQSRSALTNPGEKKKHGLITQIINQRLTSDSRRKYQGNIILSPPQPRYINPYKVFPRTPISNSRTPNPPQNQNNGPYRANHPLQDPQRGGSRPRTGAVQGPRQDRYKGECILFSSIHPQSYSCAARVVRLRTCMYYLAIRKRAEGERDGGLSGTKCT